MTDHSKDSFAELERREWATPEVAAGYARDFARAADMVVPALVDGCGAAPGQEILDLCCGHGNVTRALLATGAKVTGLDFSPAMLEMARRNAPGATYVQGDAMATGLPSGRFHGVTMGFGMPHVPDPPKAIAEAARLLRPGGRFAYSVWCGPGVESALVYVFQAIADHGDPSITLPPGPGANDYADPAIAFPALTAAGFQPPRREIVHSHWQTGDPAAPYDFFLNGTARGGALLRPQPPECARAIRQAVVDQVLEHHGSGPVWTIPIPAVVISARQS
ncbi:methyltransferase domain-containing protein [Seohaeicola saemankumensis]|nr:methyltransferase domain-containing protein [Seohaeicola saemankumensis]MCA0869736.1 methyltransferase domain-containing protein [Seohaeicola saemankumensis]